jgi:hypothetical protein
MIFDSSSAGTPINQPPTKEPTKEPEDIFAGVEKETPPVSSSSLNEPVTVKAPLISNRKLIVLMAVVVGVVVLAGAGWAVYYFVGKKNLPLKKVAAPVSQKDQTEEKTIQTLPSQTMELSQSTEQSQPTPSIEPTPSPETEINPDQEAPNKTPALDSDNDGLSDEEENSLGTNPNKIDTDDDGLYDYEEVKIYQTNPLNPDTDGDGYKDGEEVKNGYNPKGPGKLIEIPKE